MTEFWKSIPKYYCEYCNIYITDNPSNRRQHEQGNRHKANVQTFMKHQRKDKLEQEKQENRLNKELQRIEKEAQKAFQKDRSSSALTSNHSTLPQQQQQAPQIDEQELFKQYYYQYLQQYQQQHQIQEYYNTVQEEQYTAPTISNISQQPIISTPLEKNKQQQQEMSSHLIPPSSAVVEEESTTTTIPTELSKEEEDYYENPNYLFEIDEEEVAEMEKQKEELKTTEQESKSTQKKEKRKQQKLLKKAKQYGFDSVEKWEAYQTQQQQQHQSQWTTVTDSVQRLPSQRDPTLEQELVPHPPSTTSSSIDKKEEQNKNHINYDYYDSDEEKGDAFQMKSYEIKGVKRKTASAVEETPTKKIKIETMEETTPKVISFKKTMVKNDKNSMSVEMKKKNVFE